MNKSTTSRQGLRKIELFEAAHPEDYLGESTIARALRMSISTFRRLTAQAGITGLENGRNTEFKKAEVINLRDKAKAAKEAIA